MTDVPKPKVPKPKVPPPLPPSPRGIAMNFSMRIDVEEFASWDPQRISAFMGGIAQMLAAKGGQK